MREILFHGKTINSEEWAEGNYLYDEFSGTSVIVPYINLAGDVTDFSEHSAATVITETVGQYIGLTDKNGKKIFEEDIIKTKFGRLCLVKWRSTGCFCGIDLIPLETKSKAPTEWDLYCSENLEVVGNIHDNPELLEQEG